MTTLSRVLSWIATCTRAAKYLFTVRAALPKYVVGLLAFGLLPIPGPVDEAAVLLAAAVLLLRHRPILKVCWKAAVYG